MRCAAGLQHASHCDALQQLVFCCPEADIRQQAGYHRLCGFCIPCTTNACMHTVFLLYFIPAGLYCLYNNLTFINLTYFDPTTFTLLMQLRVAATGIIFQVCCLVTLSSPFVTVLLAIGALQAKATCYAVGIDRHADLGLCCQASQLLWTTVRSPRPQSCACSRVCVRFRACCSNMWLTAIAFSQILCTCFASVYNEYLLKVCECGSALYACSCWHVSLEPWRRRARHDPECVHVHRLDHLQQSCSGVQGRAGPSPVEREPQVPVCLKWMLGIDSRSLLSLSAALSCQATF